MPSGVEHYYTADVKSYTDYYAFGATLPGRNYNQNDYKYGFQGQEKDYEIKGAGKSVNYKYRMHDACVGIFLSLDPFLRITLITHHMRLVKIELLMLLSWKG